MLRRPLIVVRPTRKLRIHCLICLDCRMSRALFSLRRLRPGRPALPYPGPYFEDDPRLDPPILPLPGWFADVETEIAVAHVKNKLVNTVSIGGAAPNTVALPSAELDWTVAPRFELGYRLPSGFGAFALAYRFLTTEGTQGTIGADGPASLHSRLELNEVDFDYVSREFSLALVGNAVAVRRPADGAVFRFAGR